MEHDPEIWHAIERMAKIVEQMHGREMGLHFERKKPATSMFTGHPKIEDSGVDSNFKNSEAIHNYGQIKRWHEACKTALAIIEKRIKNNDKEAGLEAKKLNLKDLENVLYDYRTDLPDTFNLIKTCNTKDAALAKRISELNYKVEEVESWGTSK